MNGETRKPFNAAEYTGQPVETRDGRIVEVEYK
jgi:hypothetical protein